MKKYIDCDGVILDTESYIIENCLSKDYYQLSLEGQIIYRSNLEWNDILHNARIINDSISILKEMDPKTSAILTKIHSLSNEGFEKIKYFRELGVKQDVILVPYLAKKCEVAHATNNILVDDSTLNLDEWEAVGGISLFFDELDNDCDGWNIKNTKHNKIKSLNEIKNRLK